MGQRISISLRELKHFKRFCDSKQLELISATKNIGIALKNCQWDDPIFNRLIEVLKVSYKHANTLSGVLIEITDYLSKIISLVEIY